MSRTKIAAGLGLAGLVVALAACQKQEDAAGAKGPAETAGAQVDAATAKAAEALNKAGEKTGQALQSAGEKTGEVVKEGGEKLESTAKEAQTKE